MEAKKTLIFAHYLFFTNQQCFSCFISLSACITLKRQLLFFTVPQMKSFNTKKVE